MTKVWVLTEPGEDGNYIIAIFSNKQSAKIVRDWLNQNAINDYEISSYELDELSGILGWRVVFNDKLEHLYADPVLMRKDRVNTVDEWADRISVYVMKTDLEIAIKRAKQLIEDYLKEKEVD